MGHIYLSKELQKDIEKSFQNCTGCKACMTNCPMLKAFCSSPKKLLGKLGQNNEVEIIMPYSCAMCGWCSKVCPENINFKELFYDMRKEIIKGNKRLRPSGYNVVKYHQKSSFSKMFTTYSRSMKKGSTKQAKRVFLPGCSLSSYSPKLVEKTYQNLKDNFKNTDIILKCCGKPTYDMGDTDGFKKYFNSLEEDLRAMGADEVVVACENCFITLNKNLTNIKVKSLWNIIEEVGVPQELKGLYKGIDEIFYIHDPCSIREEEGIHNSIRNILTQLGIRSKEFKFSKSNTVCCGFGGMIAVTNNHVALEQMNKRAKEAKGEYIVSYCQSCVEAMNIGGGRAIHILDLLFNEAVIKDKNFIQINKDSITKWKNRYELKKIINKMK